MDEWFEVEALAPSIHRIVEGRGVLPCNTYLIEDGEDALLIDTGLGIADLRAQVESIAGVTPRVLLTHAHWDHLGAAHRFETVMVHERERADDGTVSLDVFEERFAHRPEQFVEEWEGSGRAFPPSFDPTSYRIRPVHGAETVADGDRVDVGDRQLEVVAIPGHSPGQVAAIDRTAGICFGGDILEPGGTIFAHFADADLDAYRKSLERLVGLADRGAFETLVTGHGEPIRDLSVLSAAEAAIEEILRAEPDYELEETPWGPSRAYEIDGIRALTVD